jgi:O-antigen biosynthesis protein
LKVTVITTLYNYRDYVKQAIKSFLNQSFDDAEMVIVDDASKDNPYKVIKKYESERLRYIRLEDNGGYPRAKNVGIKAAKADVLVMLDADDMLTRDSIKIRYKKIKEGYDFVHGPVLDLRGEKHRESKLWKQWKGSKKDAGCYRLVHAQSVMLRKIIHSIVGLYDESLRSKSDREMWARVFNSGKFKIGYADDYVAVYRCHSKQMHRSKEKLKINDKLQKRVLKIIERRKKDLSGVEML